MAFKELYQPVHTIIGEGCINEIPRHIEAFGGTKALIVTDPGLLKIGTVKMVTDVLDKVSMPYAIYSDVKPNPTSMQLRMSMIPRAVILSLESAAVLPSMLPRV